jgi:hypothetical protein
MLRHSSRSIFIISFVLTLTALCAGAMAQSGRRTTKPKPAPVAVPEATPSPTPQPAEPVKPTLTLVLGMEPYRGRVFNDIVDSCVDRFDDNRLVKVVTTSGGMTRDDAVKRAKAETESYVVWLQLQIDLTSSEFEGAGELFLQYWVFAPGTAKLTTSGRTHPRPTGSKRILNPRPSGTYSDVELHRAAREAAEQILRALKHPLPPTTLTNPLIKLTG